MLDEHRQMTLWAHFANVALGLWLIASPFTFGYLDMGPDSVGSGVLRVAAERDLAPLATPQHADGM